jgi:hypothetical protein
MITPTVPPFALTKLGPVGLLVFAGQRVALRDPLLLEKR